MGNKTIDSNGIVIINYDDCGLMPTASGSYPSLKIRADGFARPRGEVVKFKTKLLLTESPTFLIARSATGVKDKHQFREAHFQSMHPLDEFSLRVHNTDRDREWVRKLTLQHIQLAADQWEDPEILKTS